MVEAGPALSPSATEALRASALPGNDPGYALGVALPRSINAIGWLATSYVFGMLTVILIVRFG